MNNEDKIVQNEVSELKAKYHFLGKISFIFIDKYRFAYLIILALVFLGAQAYLKLPRESKPEVILPMTKITVSYTGAGPVEIESLVTNEIESKMNELDDVASITSTSESGKATVHVEFQPDVDMDEKNQQILTLLSQISFPEGCKDPVLKTISSSTRPIMTLSITGDYDLITLKQVGEEIQNEIEKISGISEVELIGGLDREINVYVDPIKLASNNITINQIKTAIENANLNAPEGNIALDGNYFNVRLTEEFESVEEIGDIIITDNKGNAVILKDIAEVVDTYSTPTDYSAMYIGGDNENASSYPAISLSIYREDNADIVGPSEEIKLLIEEEKGSLYPSDVAVIVNSDQAVEVKEDLSNVTNNAISGLLIVIIVLFLFIGFREAIIVSLVIPLSLFSCFILMQYNGMTFNTMTLLGLIIALGLLVDNAIVVMENVDRIRGMGLDKTISAKIATNQVAPAIMAATLTTLAAFYPLSSIPGRIGELLKVIPITLIFAIGASLVVSIIITPALCARLLKKKKKKEYSNNRIIRFLKNILICLFIFTLSMFAFSEDGSFGMLSWICASIFTLAMIIKQFKFVDKHGDKEGSMIIKLYTGFIEKVLESNLKKIIVIFISIVLFIGSIATIPLGLLKIELFPSINVSTLYISIETPVGTLLEDTIEIASEVEELLFTYPEIDSFITNVEGNSAEITIDLVPEDERTASSMDMQMILGMAMMYIPGAEISVGTNAGGRAANSPFMLELSGNDLGDLELMAEEYLNVLSSVNGIVSPFINISERSPELQITVDKVKSATFGLNPDNISKDIKNAIQGLEAGKFKENQVETSIMIRLVDGKITSVEDLNKLYFKSSTGENIPFSAICEIIETKELSQIEHMDLERTITVNANIAPTANIADVLEQFEEKADSILLIDGVTLSYGGDIEDLETSFNDLTLSLITAVILVFIFLSIQFNSLSQPLVILFSVPLAMIGVMPGLILTGNNFGLYAFMGVVSLVGIAVNDAIVLIDYTNYLRKNGSGIKEAIIIAGRTRFAPVFATSITTIGGILPLALKNYEYAQMGYSLIFGLVTSTILTLLIIPIIYSILEETKNVFKKKVEIFS